MPRRLKRSIRDTLHRNRLSIRARRAPLQRVANQLQLVYFGRVDQYKDDTT